MPIIIAQIKKERNLERKKTIKKIVLPDLHFDRKGFPGFTL